MKEFAGRIGESERTIYRWRRGESAPSFAKLVKMMRRFGVLDERAPIDFPLHPEVKQVVQEMRRAITDAAERQLEEALPPLREVLDDAEARRNRRRDE